MDTIFTGLATVISIVKQMLLDLAGMLTGNLTVVLSDTIDLLVPVADLLMEIEDLLEKVLALLAS